MMGTNNQRRANSKFSRVDLNTFDAPVISNCKNIIDRKFW
jgi:hypothetical protein